MPTTKKESLVFTLMMCSLMVLCMAAYNAARIHGVTEHYLIDVLKGFPLAFVYALVADLFLVGPLAKILAYSMIEQGDPIIKKVLIISSCMVTGMVIVMSLFGAIMGVGISDETFLVWMKNIPMNFIVALPLQVLLVGPIVRFGFGKIFKEVKETTE